MAAVRLRANIMSQAGIRWRIDIHDRDYSGSTIPIDINGCTIEYERKGDTILEPIHASEATLKAYNRDQYSADFDSFVDDLLTADELRFKMIIYKNGATTLYWVGNVIIDNCNYENLSNPRIFEIKATDGFGRLKNIPFAEAIPVGGVPVFNELIQHLTEALAYNDLAQFWGASDPYIQESFEFTETQVGAIAAGESMLLFTRYSSGLNLKTYADITLTDTDRVRTAKGGNLFIDDKDTDEPFSAHQVLENIMRILCCRIMISDGVYRIQQVRNFDGSGYTARNFKKDQTILNNVTITPRQTTGPVQLGNELQVLAGGQIDFMQPLNKARLRTPNIFQSRLLKINDLTISASTSPVTDTVELGDVVGGTDKRINIAWRQNLINLLVAGKRARLTITFKFVFGTAATPIYRLLGTSALLNNWAWTSGTAGDEVTIIFAGSGLHSRDSSITTPDIPTGTHTAAQVIITITQDTIPGTTGAALTDADFKMIFRLFAVSLRDGSLFQDSATYEVDNPDSSDNSTIQDFGTLSLADTGIITNLNSWQVDTGGSTWVNSADWNAGFPGNESLARTILKEAMSLQKTPVERRQMNLEGDWSAYQVAFYDSKPFVFNGGTQNLHDDEVNGEWFELITVKTGISINKVITATRANLDRDPGILTALKDFQDWMDDWKDFDAQQAVMSTLEPAGGAVTSLPIIAPGHDLMKKGDKISLMDAHNGVEVLEVVLDADVGSADTSMTIVSITVPELPAMTWVRHKPSQVVTSELGRFDNLQMISAPAKKINIANASTFDIETDMYKISSEFSQTGTQVIELPLADDCWDANTSTGLEFIVFDTDENASINNVTVQVEGGSGDEIIDTQSGQSSTIIGEDGFDLTIQCISATQFKIT